MYFEEVLKTLVQVFELDLLALTECSKKEDVKINKDENNINISPS